MHHDPLHPPVLSWSDSDVPRSEHYGDIYFSSENGVAETEHVFIEGNCLRDRWQKLSEGSIFTIGETGFGSGLNFLCAAALFIQLTPASTRLHFFSVEKHPFTQEDLQRALAKHPAALKFLAKELLDQYPPLVRGLHRLILCQGRIHLTLSFGEALNSFNAIQFRADAWFLDGFAPRLNPDMWQAALFRELANHSDHGTTLATFTAAGEVRRGLEDVGFEVARVAGFGSKRHMSQAVFRSAFRPAGYPTNLMPPQIKRGHIVVVGAGISGACCAYLLAQSGWKVTIIDEETIASGASGNSQGALYISPGVEWSAHTRLHIAAFLFAYRFYQHIAKLPSSIWHPTGLLSLYQDDKEKLRQAKLLELNQYPSELLRAVKPQEASKLAGITLSQGGLLFTLGGWLNPKKTCRFLIEQSNATLISNCAFQGIEGESALGGLNIRTSTQMLQADHLILATAHLPTSSPWQLPIKSIKGQISKFVPTPMTSGLRMTICGEGYVMPPDEGMQLTGASFHVNQNDREHSPHDDTANLDKLIGLLNLPTDHGICITESRVAVRYTLPDYMPVAGTLPYAYSQAKVMHIGALGSKGLVLAPLLGQLLVDMLEQGVPPLEADLSKRVSPQRYDPRSRI